MTLTVPEKMRDRASYFLGDNVAADPDFWMLVLRTGIKDIERRYRQMEEALMDDIVENGGSVIVGPAIVVDSADSATDLDDDIPF